MHHQHAESALPIRPRGLIAALVALALLLVGGSAFIASRAAAAVTFPTTFLSTASTTWHYSDNNTDPAAGNSDRLVWTYGDFDDSAWKSAVGPFGAKNGAATGLGSSFPVTTLLNQYIDGKAAPDVKTFHFRTSFDITADQLGALASLSGQVTYDDGVQIFVNGTKVAGLVIDDLVEAAPYEQRNLMYAGTSGGDPKTSTFSVPASVLRAGTNTVAIALYQDRTTSSDIYLDLKSLTPVQTVTAPSFSDIVLSIGADESQRGLTWYTDQDSAQVAQVAKKSAMTGSTFPESAATTVNGAGAATTSGEYNRKATFTGLEPNTEYVYRVGAAGSGWSSVYSFRTQSFTGDYNFLFFGDPQIGASGNVANDQAGWTDTLNVAQAAYPDSELLFSAGDQVESASNEAQYAAFLAPDQLRQIPLVPVNGNHDVGSKAYEQHYSVPNLDSTAGAATSASSSGGDYWFMYKGTLFIVINTNSSDVASHEAFMRSVVAAHGADAKWKVLAFHHSIYSVAAHVNDSQIQNLRAALPTVISDLGIDLVLQGHDHSYTRTYLVKDGQLADAGEVAGQATVVADPGENLYVTANSASGSKYYSVTAPSAWYASVINQERVRNYSNIEITDDSITVTTLRSQANGDAAPVNSVVDAVTLRRAGAPAPTVSLAVNTVSGAAHQEVTLTATVTDAAAGDVVEFRDGTTAIGTAPVSDGTASLLTNQLGAGSHDITAVLVRTGLDPVVSNTVSATYDNPTGPVDVEPQDVILTLPRGTISIISPYSSAHPLDLGTATLDLAARGVSASAPFSGIVVNDTRLGNLGFSASIVSSDFVATGDSFSATHAGVRNLVATQVAGNALDASKVVLHDRGAADGGIAAPWIFATYPPGISAGMVEIGGVFEVVDVPTSHVAGLYTATLTLTAL